MPNDKSITPNWQERCAELEKAIQVLEEKSDNAFQVKEGRPLLLVKLGNPTTGWIPAANHFAAARRWIKQAQLDKVYNIFLFHYGINMEIVGEKTEVKQTDLKTTEV